IDTSINLIQFFEYYPDDYFDDWSFLVYPIVIGLEGYIKWLLIKSDIKINNHFRYFDKECKPYKLKDNVNYNKKKKEFIDIAEDCYNIYVLYRHKLCHYEITNNLDYCFKIENKEYAIKIFNDIYSCFKEV
ncbi:MAG: hypothetical protein K2L64_03665, partial [Ureaplasma sp.]|nr:hypothetical protein [Ureaplasma sp.]